MNNYNYYIIIYCILWMETPSPQFLKDIPMDRNKNLNIIVDLLLLSPIHGSKRKEKNKKKKRKKRAGSGLDTILLTYVFTQLWFVVSGLIYW